IERLGSADGGGTGFGVVADVDAFHQEQHVFGDVGGVIGDALQVADHYHQIKSLLNVAGVLLHETSELVVAGGAQAIDGVIGSEHAAGEIGIAVDKSIERLAHHGLHQTRNVGNVDHGRDNGTFHQRERSLTYAHGEVSHTLQVGV